MLSQYVNINQILNASASLSAERIPDNKRSLLTLSNNLVSFTPNVNSQTTADKIELHLYSNSTWITGLHQVQPEQQVGQYIDKDNNQPINLINPINIDLYKQLDNLNITNGSFRIVVNFFRNLIGSYNTQYLVIDDISPDRTELRLRAISPTNTTFLQQVTNFINTVKQTQSIIPPNSTINYYKSYLLNFSRNKCVSFINIVVIGEYIYVKLLQPLPEELKLDFKCWIVEESKKPYIDRINVIPAIPTITTTTTLANPNWAATPDFNTSTDTGIKTWNDLLGSSTQTSQQIIDAYFSGSLSGIKLNIDYSDFNNFIFYSSATERLENFKYKLQLLEYYTAQSASVSLISGSVSTTNAQDLEKQRVNLISGFDAFESFLYYESSSKLTTYTLPLANANVPAVTGSYITPIPKTNSTKPYNIVSINSSQFTTWFDTIYSYAKLYDASNYNSLINAIPEHIRFSQDSVNLHTFVNMLGHHYDIMYTYINHMTNINKREENPKLGMPNELLYSVAKQFGWNLTDGNQSQDLWKYVLGTNETGIPLTGSNSVNQQSLSGQDMTYTVWRRIVNNLPLLLKSKGTKRSVQALLSCYGIPQSIITIKEFGGPRLDRTPIYEKLNFDYALDLITNTAGSVTVNYSQSINTVELRFRTDNVVKNPLLPSTMTLFTVGSNVVTLDYTSGTLGTIQINGTSSANIEMFDGGWLTTMLKTSGNKLQVVAKRSKYGKIISAVSASATASFAGSTSVVLGSTSTGASRLQGQLQELRLWSSSLNDSAFNNHVKAPAAYNGNTDAYNELVFRLPLTQKVNHTATGSLTGAQPVSSSISASFTSWTNAEPYDSVEETYYYDSISLGTGTFDDNKIRLENNVLVGTLDVKTRAEQSQYDKAPVDTNKLAIYFSPQTIINEDIIAQLGFTVLDDYIGDPGDDDSFSYPALIKKSHEYWKKYVDKNDINAYIKIFTLFDMSFFRQLEQILPARANKLTGLLIQPNLLERSKQSILPKAHKFHVTYDTIISEVQPTASADYTYYTGQVTNIATLSSDVDIKYQAYLTASADERYNGSTYSYQYAIWNGTTYTTGSTPYWLSEALMPTILNANVSEYRLSSGSVLYPSASASYYGTSSYGSGSYTLYGYQFSSSLAQVQDYRPTGMYNQKYDGCKLTSADFNINSPHTVDGKPPVEWKPANGSQLIYQELSDDGSFLRG